MPIALYGNSWELGWAWGIWNQCSCLKWVILPVLAVRNEHFLHQNAWEASLFCVFREINSCSLYDWYSEAIFGRSLWVIVVESQTYVHFYPSCHITTNLAYQVSNISYNVCRYASSIMCKNLKTKLWFKAAYFYLYIVRWDSVGPACVGWFG